MPNLIGKFSPEQRRFIDGYRPNMLAIAELDLRFEHDDIAPEDFKAQRAKYMAAVKLSLKSEPGCTTRPRGRGMRASSLHAE